MKKITYCFIILVTLTGFSFAGNAGGAVYSNAIEIGSMNRLADLKVEQKMVNKTINFATKKVFKNTFHSVEGSALKIGRIVTLFVLCGLGAIILLFALI
jgi:hypothetical protein